MKIKSIMTVVFVGALSSYHHLMADAEKVLKDFKPDLDNTALTGVLEGIKGPAQLMLGAIGVFGVLRGLFGIVSALGDENKKMNVQQLIQNLFYFLLGFAGFGYAAASLYGILD